MPVTLKNLADTLGIAKSTVIYNAKQLGIYDDIKVVGGRGTRVPPSGQTPPPRAQWAPPPATPGTTWARPP